MFDSGILDLEMKIIEIKISSLWTGKFSDMRNHYLKMKRKV